MLALARFLAAGGSATFFFPTPTLPYLQGEEAAGTNGSLFYVLFFIGAILFLAAFFYGRRHRA